MISQVVWDIAVLEEAHRLSKSYTGENKTANALKKATADAYKLLRRAYA
ncbi:hypothetical protein AGMMS49975_21440 [Clostridia bacterium]|nr:hypothetical protein AGMMS49975_21440 [Clostridia bacterium]